MPISQALISRSYFLRSICASAFVLAATSGWAQAAQLADISIVERASGKVLQVYRSGGEYWVAGRPGANYAIRVRNTTGQRIMGVMSVDGVNVLTGKTAAAAPRDGYIFDSYESADILGWRKNMDKVAAFYFSESDMSYASRTGRPMDVGVIGVALFREKEPEPQYSPPVSSGPVYEDNSRMYERESKSSSAADSAVAADAPAAPNASARSKSSSSMAEAKRAPVAPKDEAARSVAPRQTPSLGTGHGAVESSHVGMTEFESATNRPEQIVRIRYDSYANLVAKGVIPQPRPRPLPPRTPRAFPGDNGFVPNPPAN